MRAKYSGAGNSFLFFDSTLNLQLPFSKHHADVAPSIPKLCADFQTDGIILIEPSLRADCKMRTFNADGSEAEMCGNGLRCAIVFLRDLGRQKRVYSIETEAGIKRGWIEGDQVAAEMDKPHSFQSPLAVDVENETYYGHFINTGVPHFIIFSSDNLDFINVDSIGRTIRYHSVFAPHGTNVSFVSFPEQSSLRIRTYERGVERETPACGTGATAAALVAAKLFDLDSPVEMIPLSGEKLRIRFNADWSEIVMQGPVKKII